MPQGYMSGKSSGVTMAKVAQISGVSLSTVSLVLNHKPGIPPETRLKVLTAAEKLGYQLKNNITEKKSVSSSEIKTIGVFVKSQFDDPIPPTSNVFYSHVLAGIEESCRLNRLLLMLSVVRVDSNSFPLEIPHLLQNNAIDAVLLVGICINEMLDTVLKQTNLLIILVDAYSYFQEYDSVVIKNFEAGYQAANYLIDQGHRHIAFIGGYGNSHPSFVDRRRGYLQALRDKGITEDYIGDCSYNDPQAVFKTLRRIKHESPQITAVMACNDKVAIELIQAANELCITVPGEISVIGFDNITLADKITPPLTTMNIDKVSLGRLAVEIMRFRSRFPETAVIQASLFPTIIERMSVRKL
jgi:LacI family transcriptional regulator